MLILSRAEFEPRPIDKSCKVNYTNATHYYTTRLYHSKLYPSKVFSLQTMLNSFVTFLYAWLQAYNCVLLFGLFYGFLSTLPLGPSQIYFTRSFILEHDERKRSELQKKFLGQEKGFRLRESHVILSGSLLAQAVVFLSIYCAPIYGVFFKPHAMLLLAIPIVYVIIHKYIQDISPNPIKLFLIGGILQLMNPVLFFSDSVFTRLINLLLFRYTANFVFLISVFIGWLSGQIFFIKCAKLFCLRIERDSALLGSKYLLSKRYIKETFKILFFGYFFLFCFGGSIPSLIFTKRFKEELFGRRAFVEPFPTIRKSLQELREGTQGEDTRVRLFTKYSDKETSKRKKEPVVVPIQSETEADAKVAEVDQELKPVVVPIQSETEADAKVAEVDQELKKVDEKKPYPIEFIISPWMGKTWPNLFYDYRRWNWPLRYIEVKYESRVQWHFLGPLKTEVSDYFFDTCVSDGRERLSFTSSPSISLYAKMIREKRALPSGSVSGSEIDCSNEDNLDKWIVAKRSRRDYLGSELEDRVKAISKGSSILDVMEKRVKFSTESGRRLPEIEDPFLSGPVRGIMEHSESPWIPLCKSENKFYEDILTRRLSERLREQPHTPEEKLKRKRTINQIKKILLLMNKNKIRKEMGTKFRKHRETGFIRSKAMDIARDFFWLSHYRFSFRLPITPSSFIIKMHKGKPKRIRISGGSNKLISKDIEQTMMQLYYFSAFLDRTEKEKYTDRNGIGRLHEGSISREGALCKLIDNLILFINMDLEKQLSTFEGDNKIYDQKEKEDLEKNISAHLLPFPENKKVKSIVKFWLPLFDLFQRRKVGLKKLEKLVISKRKAEKSLNPNIYGLFNKIFLNELKLSEIKRDVPFWASKLRTGSYDDFGEKNDLDVGAPEIRSALNLDPKGEDIPIISWIWETDDDRTIIKGSVRAQRRNLNTWMLIDPYVRSSFFVRYSEMRVKEEVRRKSKRKEKRKVNFYTKRSRLKHSRGPLRKMYKPFTTRAELGRLEELTWMDEEFVQFVRSVGLVSFLYIRKFILIPLFIITKNIVRTLLLQFPMEWKQDWDDWTKEMYVICDYDGVEYSETEYPEDFWEIGIQIKILSPFRFKPWHDEHPEADAGYLTMNPIVLIEKPFYDAVRDSKAQRKEDMFQVIWDEFLGPVRRFWGPRIKKAISRIKGVLRPVIGRIKEILKRIKESIGRVIGRIKEVIKRFMIKFDKLIKHIKELIGQVIERIKNWMIHIKELIGQVTERFKNWIGLVMKRIQWIKKSELRPGNKSIDDVEMNYQVASQLRMKTKQRVEDKSVIKTQPNVKKSTNKIKQRVEDKSVIKTRPNVEKSTDKSKQKTDEIKQITETYLLNLEVYAKLKKENDQYYHDIGSGLQDKLVQKIREITSRKKSVRFNNSRYSKKLFLIRKLLVIKFKLNVINLTDSILEFWNRSKRKIAAIGNNFSIQSFFTKKTQDLKIGPDKISQAYVFHKMWQIRVMNKSYAKELLKSRTSSPLIQKNIKELLDIQGILESKQPQDLKANHWKQWLNFCYGYRVSKTKGSLFSQVWSRIAPHKWGNRLSKQWSKREIESFLGMLCKWNKRYRYDLLAYNYLDYRKEHLHGPVVQDMVIRNIPDHPNTNKKTRKTLVSNFFALDKSDLKLRKSKTKLNKTEFELDKIKLNKSDERSDKKSDEKEKNEIIGEDYMKIFAEKKETDQISEKETNQISEKETNQISEKETNQISEKETNQISEKETNDSLGRSKSKLKSNQSKKDIKSNQSKMDFNKNKADESLLIDFLDGYKFLKSYWFFPIFAENRELSEVIQTIRSDLSPLIEYCERRLAADKYLSELNSYYSELCKERAKKVRDINKIIEIRSNLSRLSASLEELSPPMTKFIKKAYAKSDLKLPWLKPNVSLHLTIKKKKISKNLLEEETEATPQKTRETTEETEATPQKTGETPEETEATREAKIQLIREEISKLMRKEAGQVFELPTTTEFRPGCEAYYEVALMDYLRKADEDLFVPLNKVRQTFRLHKELVKFEEKLVEAIDAFHFISAKRESISERDFWKKKFSKNFFHIFNDVAELDRFPTIQLQTSEAFKIVVKRMKEAMQPKKQDNEEKRDDNDKNAYNELKFQLKPGWKKGDDINMGLLTNRARARVNIHPISRTGGIYLLKEELWFLSRYEYIVNTLDFLLYSDSNKSESDKSKSDESKSNKAEPAKDEKVHEKKRKRRGDAPLSTRAIRQLHRICHRKDATDIVVFLHKFYRKRYAEVLELQHMKKEKHIAKYIANYLSFNDSPHYWALLGRCDDRSLVDQMLFDMWLDPLVCLSAVSKDIRVLKLNNRFREGLYVDLSDRSVRRILNDKISSSLIFEDILLPRRRREFRILNRLNLENNLGEQSTECSNGKEYVQSDEELMEKGQYLGIDTTQEMKRFLWPRYRVEDLICMNRYWWNRYNRSRTVLKVRMYPKMDNWNSWENFLCLITEYMRKLLFLMDSVMKKLLFYLSQLLLFYFTGW
uniref:Protein TIC 214 n=1 Tax=Saxegothaea conspicua TaxID=56905 RepID=A0A3S5IBY3_9CONI|nr:hypothetical protein RF1 [Saxegothaea conspicua]BBF91299.1 hypothetical protein [Saxegothaea conspicua]